MAVIDFVQARRILDSRGYPTVEVDIVLDNGIIGRDASPSGASTGEFEAVEIRDGGKNYLGKDVQTAIDNVNHIIAPRLWGKEITEQRSIDRILREIDREMADEKGIRNEAYEKMPKYSFLGGNASTAVSMACLRAAANSRGLSLYEHLGGNILPIPMLNVLNGGKHADFNVSIQEFMIVPIGFDNFSDAIRASAESYGRLREIVKKQFGTRAGYVGDEGGFAPKVKSTRQALDLINQAIKEAGYEKQMYLATDSAATSFYDATTDTYLIDKKTKDPNQMLSFYVKLSKDYPNIISMEDPFHEHAFDSHTALTLQIGDHVQIVSDDLSVSQYDLVRKVDAQKSANSILVKYNQAGDWSEANDVISFCNGRMEPLPANFKKMLWVMSHRSGETEHATLADLAVGTNAPFIKLGAPARERNVKINQLLRIQDDLLLKRSKAVYAGARLMGKSNQQMLKLMRD